MEVSKGVTLEYKDGKAILSADISSLVSPVLLAIKAKVESGEIDPVKGTDVDKEILLKALSLLLAEVGA